MKRLVRNRTRTAGETDEMKSNEMNHGIITLSSLTGGSSVCVCWGGNDPHSLQQARHIAKSLWDWSSETEASY